MLENEKLYIKIEKNESTYEDFFEKFHIEQTKRNELRNKKILFVPKYYRDIKEPCFTENFSSYYKIIKNELKIDDIGLCINDSDSYKEYHMHSSTFFLGTILTQVAINVISKIICDTLEKQTCPKNDDIVNVNIINPEINVNINFNDTYENLKKLPELYSTYTKTGKMNNSETQKGNILDVTA